MGVWEAVWGGETTSYRSILFDAARHDLERAIGQGTLQRPRIAPRRRQPCLHLVGCGEDHRHGLGVDRPDFRVRLSRQECEQIGGNLPFLHLAHTGPLRGPYAGKEGQGAGIVKGEPNIASSVLVELAERGEGHDAPEPRRQPSSPVLAIG